MLAGLRMHNVEPGPMLFKTNPEIFWTFIAAMYIGNLMLLILNLPLVGMFGKIAVIRPQILMPVISLICLVGVYSVRNSIFDVWIMIAAGVVGYFLRKWKFPVAPFIIGVVLGPTTENSVRQTPHDVQRGSHSDFWAASCRRFNRCGRGLFGVIN